MGDIHAIPEAIRDHADEVRSIGTGIVDGAVAGVRSMPDLNFGLIPGPVIYPPMIPLFTTIEAALTALAGIAGDISLSLQGVAEIYEVAEDTAKKLVTKAGQS